MLVQFRLKLLYQFSETIMKCVWQRIGRMEVDCNLKTFSLLRLLEKSPETV